MVMCFFIIALAEQILPGGDLNILINSIKTQLFTLPDDYVVYTGHGPSTTIGNEKKYNPFVGENVS